MYDSFTTARLRLRRPVAADAAAIFTRYAADAEVTRYLSWPRHASMADTEAFLAFANAEWQRAPSGPLLIETLDGELLGSTGLSFESDTHVSTGYVLARDAWGKGYATEALGAMVETARSLGVRRVEALCHHAHDASAHVLAKGGFDRVGLLPRHTVFPNLAEAEPQDVLRFARVFDH